MRVLYADELCQWSEREIWAQKDSPEKFRLVFHDAEIITNWQLLLVSWYYWEAFRDYPLTPICLKHYLYDEYFSPAIEGKLLNRAKDAIIASYPDELLSNIQAALYRGQNRIHNAFTTQGEAFVDTVDALTLLEIWEHPEIQAAVQSVEPTAAGVNRCYGEISRVINHDAELRENTMAVACHIGQTKVAQFHQVTGLRGFCSDANQAIFPTMVNASFATGIHRASFFAMVSRDATKALQATDDPVKQTEYYNRELQLFTYVVKSVEKGDCGTTETVPWLVKKKELDKILPGNNYVDEHGTVRTIRPGDDHLVGKVIQLRNVACCWHPKDGVVCSTCLGKLAEAVQPDTNLGHAGTVTQNEGVSQDVISTKHLLRSADSEGFEVDPFYSNLMVNASEISELMLSQEIWDKHVEVEIDMAYLPRLADIHVIDEFRVQDLLRISAIEDLTLLVHQGDEQKTTVTTIVPTSHGSYRPYLTAEFVQHMKDYGFVNLGKKIRVDLMNWNPSASIVKFPERHSSTLEMMMELKSNIFMSNPESKMKLRYDLTDPDILGMALKDICDMTNRKFSVNLSIVSLVLYGMMSRDPKNHDFRLPKKGTGRRFSPKGDIMNGRSLSVKCAYEKQFTMIQSPMSYLQKIRPNHSLDFCVVNVSEEIRKRRF